MRYERLVEVEVGQTEARVTLTCSHGIRILLQRQMPIDKELRANGYAFRKRWLMDASTEEVANSLGEVLRVTQLLPGSNIPSVQSLVPRPKSKGRPNDYSGVFGLSTFPLHTDLAHWAWPPRYLLLRCVTGSPRVATNVLPVTALEAAVGVACLRRAVARPRRVGRSGAHVLLPIVLKAGSQLYMRWDSLFLVPMNDGSNRIADVLAAGLWNSDELLQFYLTDRGDTLILDNWRCLHGRSHATLRDTNRRVERVYLSDLTL
jgi:L-asparagine oxygenase